MMTMMCDDDDDRFHRENKSMLLCCFSRSEGLELVSLLLWWTYALQSMLVI